MSCLRDLTVFFFFLTFWIEVAHFEGIDTRSGGRINQISWHESLYFGHKTTRITVLMTCNLTCQKINDHGLELDLEVKVTWPDLRQKLWGCPSIHSPLLLNAISQEGILQMCVCGDSRMKGFRCRWSKPRSRRLHVDDELDLTCLEDVSCESLKQVQLIKHLELWLHVCPWYLRNVSRDCLQIWHTRPRGSAL